MITCSQNVIVEDNELPTITCPPSQIIPTDFGLCTASSAGLGTAITTDNCGVASVTNNAPLVFPLGETVVTWTVTDDSGNMATCEQIITVADAQGPMITCPGDITIECTASTDPADTGMATATDNCGVDEITFSDVIIDGDCPVSFTIQRTYRAIDDSGISSECLQTITVEDTMDPTASNPAPVTIQCFSDIPAADINVVTDAEDNCDGAVTVAFVGDDVTSAVCDGAPVVVTRRYSVTDCAMNSIEVTQTITVEDTMDPTASNPAPVTIQCFSCLLYTSPSPRDRTRSRMPSSA